MNDVTKFPYQQQVDLCKDAYCYANGTQMVLWQAFVKDTGNIRCSCG